MFVSYTKCNTDIRELLPVHHYVRAFLYQNVLTYFQLNFVVKSFYWFSINVFVFFCRTPLTQILREALVRHHG